MLTKNYKNQTVTDPRVRNLMGKHAWDIDTQAKGKTVKTVGQHLLILCLRVETDVVSITY